MKINRKKIILLNILFVIIIFLVMKIGEKLRIEEKQNILNNYSITIGRIIDIGRWGDPGSKTIIYSYKVDSIEYKRSIYPMIYYPECETNFNLCKEKRFWVIYYKSDPRKSLINLNHEIQGLANPIFPKSLDHFE